MKKKKPEIRTSFNWLNFILTGMMIFSACKKEVAPESILNINSILGFSERGNQLGIFVKPTADEGYILYNFEDRYILDYNILNVRKLNARGQVVWKKKYDQDSLNSLYTPLEDGGLLLVSFSNDFIMRFDADGQLLFKTRFIMPPGANSSMPLLVKDGSHKSWAMFALTDGPWTNNNTTNQIKQFKPNGDYHKTIKISDLNFKAKIRYLNLYRYEDPETYYFFGLCYENNWNWTQSPKLFAAKLQFSDSTVISSSLKILDSDKLYYHDVYGKGLSIYLPAYVELPDKSVIIGNNKINQVSKSISGFLTRIDMNQNLIWQVQLPVSGSNILLTYLSKCADGNIMVSGIHRPENKSNEEAFICKVSPEGKMLWAHYYPGKNNSTAWFATQTDNGSCLITGGTTGFSNGTSSFDTYFMKTDEFGNLK